MDRRDTIIAALVAVGLVALYSADRELLPSHDAAGNVYLAAEVIEHGQLSFTPSRTPWVFRWRLGGDEFGGVFSMHDRIDGIAAGSLYGAGKLLPVVDYFLAVSERLDPVTGERLFVNTFGPGAALTAVPFLWVVRLVTGDLVQHPAALWYTAKLVSSTLVAGSAALLFLVARRWLSRRAALILTIAYGAATCVWSISSQALWQHGPAEFFLALAAFALLREHLEARWACVAGMALGAAVACRPPLGIVAVVFAAWLAVSDRRAFVALVLAALPFVVALGAYDAHFFGSPFRLGQTEASRVVALEKTGVPALWSTPPWIGLPGVLVSPSRGLFVFSPWLLIAVPGLITAWRDATWRHLRPVSIAAALLIAIESTWFDWWGGWSFGYRRVVDVVPLLALLAIPVLQRGLSRTGKAAVGVALAWSVAVQGLGVLAYDVHGWNGRRRSVSGARGDTVIEAMDVDQPPYRWRLWSLADNELGYYLSHFEESRASRTRFSREWTEIWWSERR